ncbi:hypothetical protein KMZ93_05890 [Bradyrhizobium sediminis]|uniref:Uncharacterized protein n=1 Tax=Bradyrhizobium sediminis TaxID=2840469 RepID=A0A975NZR2_9BRAD|nr:hypothetical protein [Bradyrhizobium sediminis]QWG24437.1 hypothetical protein KMZ93_05890 [Bradyrhizobium sediminis]
MIVALFVTLVLAVVLGHLLAAWFSARRTGLPPKEAAYFTGYAGAAAASLLLLSVTASASGLIANFNANPPYLMRFLLPHLVFTLILGSVSRYGRRLALGLPIVVLIGLQAFRIPVELLLDALYAEGIAPVQITYRGWNFDILTGLTALPVAWLAAHGKASRTLLMAWNILGLALLANVVIVALTSMPGPLRLFFNEPSAGFIASLPYIFVPTVFVTTALLGHVLLFRRLQLEAKSAELRHVRV